MAEEQQEAEARQGRGGEREKSTISFPYGDLENGIKIARAVHRVGGTSCQWEQLGAELGMAPKGGGFRILVATAKVFGLVSYGGATVTLTELGARICDAVQEPRARVDAFLTVPLYQELFEKFRAATLPPDAALESEMAALGVVKKQTQKARQAFQRSAQQAGFFKYGRERIVMPSTGNSVEPGGTANSPRNDDESSRRADRDGNSNDFIGGLVRKLPVEGTEWSTADRSTWLQAANAIFELLYKRPENEGKLRIEIQAGGSETPT